MMSATGVDIKEFRLLIDGSAAKSSNAQYFDSINPSNGEVFARVSDATQEDMARAIRSARTAFDSGVWCDLTVQERGQYLKKIAVLIREHAKELAELESLDVGKTQKQTTFIDVPTAADTFEYFGNIKDQLTGKINPLSAPVKSLTEHEPMGVIGCIIPWNYPLIMSAWKMAPALIAGNTIILKPSMQACVSVMKLAQLIAMAELPKGAVNIVSSSQHEVAGEMLKSRDVDMISFTGGTETGQEIMRQAAATTKKLTLELGGKSPNIVFADSDREAALGGTMSAIFMNQGQMCTAGSRLLLEDKIYEEFLQELIARTKKLKIGNSSDYDTEFGPLISASHRQQVLEYIKKGIDGGAELVCGGHIPEDESFKSGYYLEPTIFANVTNDLAIAQEEIFGPVLSVIRFSSTAEAIEIANDSKFGLAACVWTKDLEKANHVAKELKCGTVWINTYGGFYNEAPYGGYKQSGFGRELGTEGLLEYTQAKHVCIHQTPGGKPLAASWF